MLGDLTHQLFFLGCAKDNVYVPTLLPELEVLKTRIMEACSRADDDRLRQTWQEAQPGLMLPETYLLVTFRCLYCKETAAG